LSQNQQAATLPDAQTAYNNLFMGVHQNVFFRKCAAAGYYPRNQEEAQWMLDTAGKLRLVDQVEPQVKQAAAQNNPYFAANQALDQVLSQYGLDGGIQQQRANEEEMAIKQAAAELAQDPTFYNSVLALKSAEAAQVQAQLAEYQRQQQQGR
jgi:hypothetical protein